MLNVFPYICIYINIHICGLCCLLSHIILVILVRNIITSVNLSGVTMMSVAEAVFLALATT